MKSLLVLALMTFTFHSMGANYTLNFRGPVTLKKVVFEKKVTRKVSGLFKALPQEKLISKN